MIEWSIFLVCFLLLISIGQAVYVVIFARALIPSSENGSAYDPEENRWPKAAVLLCVRGLDPTLANCLTSTFAQDYPNFVVHIIVDHADDPAAETVQRIADGHDNAVVHFVASRAETCSLKCNSLIKAISSLDDSVDIVAMLDADSEPHPLWLRQLASGLNDSDVGVVSGIRCYLPPDSKLGTLIRYQWNSAASVQMFVYKIPWGGTLAFRRQTIDELDLISKWQNAFCEDTMLADIMKNHGLRAHISPDLCMPNSESCEIMEFLPFVSRQLLTARLYHSKWPLVVCHAWITTFATVAAIFTLFAAIACSNPTAIFWTALGIVIYQLANWSMLSINEKSVTSRLAMNNQADRWRNVKKQFLLFALTPVTQLVYFAAVINAGRMRKVSWRQVEYQIDGPFKIERKNYAPYQSLASDQTSL